MNDTPTQKSEPDNAAVALTDRLFDWARHGETDSLRGPLQQGQTPDIRDSDGNTLLMLSSCNGHYETSKLLLEHGADINAVNPEGKTPLMLAAVFNHADIVDLLLINSADAYAKSADGLTALALARAMGAELAARRIAQHVELF